MLPERSTESMKPQGLSRWRRRNWGQMGRLPVVWSSLNLAPQLGEGGLLMGSSWDAWLLIRALTPAVSLSTAGPPSLSQGGQGPSWPIRLRACWFLLWRGNCSFLLFVMVYWLPFSGGFATSLGFYVIGQRFWFTWGWKGFGGSSSSPNLGVPE